MRFIKIGRPNPAPLLSTDLGWLRLFLLLRLADGRVSVERIISDLRQRGVVENGGRTVRRLLHSLEKKGYVRWVAERPGDVVSTAAGRRVATEARARLTDILNMSK